MARKRILYGPLTDKGESRLTLRFLYRAVAGRCAQASGDQDEVVRGRLPPVPPCTPPAYPLCFTERLNTTLANNNNQPSKPPRNARQRSLN